MKQKNTVLIVDDDPGARDILEALLLKEEYRLAFASNGDDALKKAVELMPSLILLDVMMPEMDGFEVCQRLRAIPLLAEVPIIMLTALDDRRSRLHGIEAGADDFISKPFDREELRVRIRAILRLNRYRRLHAERAKFEWVVQQATDGYVIINKSDKILYANAYGRLYLGLPPEEQPTSSEEKDDAYSNERFLELAQKHYLLKPQNVWESWPNQTEASLLVPRFLVRPESPTAEAFWLQVDVFELPFESNSEWVVRISDVTAQVIASRNKRGFHTIICHKLRTPLVGILGSLELLSTHVARFSKTEVAEFSTMAFESAKRLHSEIEDILQYLEAPHAALSEKGCSMAEVRSSIMQIGTDLEMTSVTTSIPKDLEQRSLMLSQRAVELILWELLENSKKFHPTHTPTVEISIVRTQSERVKILIQDNGLSLSPKQLSQIWAPYYQGEKYSTGETQGMGLGLSMVAAFVWEVGGTCHAYNQPNQPGLIIEVHLPLAPVKSVNNAISRLCQ